MTVPASCRLVLRGGGPWGLGLTGGTGTPHPLTVNQLDPDGKAGDQGLRVGDIIVSINDVSVDCQEEAVQLISSAFNTLTLTLIRGNFDQNHGPKSQSFLRKSKELRERDADGDRAQDDSIVYAESKSSKHGTKLRPQRRGESFNIKSTTGNNRKRDSRELPGRPVSWQSLSALGNNASPNNYAEPPGGHQVKSIGVSPSTQPPEQHRSMQHHSGGATSSKIDNFGGSFHSLQTLPPSKSRGSRVSRDDSGAESLPRAESNASMSLSTSWHGAPHGMSSQSLATNMVGEPPPVEPKMKSNVYQYLSRESGLDFSPRMSRQTAPDSSRMPPEVSPHAQSMQDIRHFDGDQTFQYQKHSGYRGHVQPQQPWGRSPSYGNYENIEAFDGRPSTLQSSPSRSQSSSCLNPERYFLPEKYATSSTDPMSGSAYVPLPPPKKGDSEPPKPPCSPPAPPVRDASSLKYVKVGQTHEKYPSWPTMEQGEEVKSKGSSRSNSWAANTTTSQEYSKKPKFYQPRLNTHTEEKAVADPLHKLLDDDSMKSPSEARFHTDLIHRAVVAKVENLDNYALDSSYAFDTTSKGEMELKSLYNTQPSYPYPKYDRDGRLKDDKDYVVPSPPERDVPLEKHVSSSKRRSQESSSFPADMSTLDELLQQYASDPQKESSPPPPPLPSFPPPPLSLPADLAASSSSPGNQNHMVFTMARSPQHSSYTYIVRSKPYYNTSTQTEELPSQTGEVAVEPEAQEEAQPQLVEYRHVEVQVDMDLVVSTPAPSGTLERKRARKSERSTQIIESELVEQAASALRENVGRHDPVTMVTDSRDAATRPLPVVDKVENRIPETIREESPHKVSPQAPKHQDSGLRDNILAQIHEHSPSQTYMLRKLSQEFYGNQSRLGYGPKRTAQLDRDRTSSKELLKTIQHDRKPSNEISDHFRPGSQHSSSDYWSDTEGTLQDRSRASSLSERHRDLSISSLRDSVRDKENSIASDFSDKNDLDKTSPLSRQLSLKKAYGTFDEIENFEDRTGRKPLSNHGKSVSASSVSHQRQLGSFEVRESGGSSRSRDSKDKDVHMFKSHANSQSDQHVGPNFLAQNNDLKKVIPESPKKLKRTTSEQIRPVKERERERERSSDKHKLSDPESSKEKRGKYSESCQNSVPELRRSSDPKESQQRRSLDIPARDFEQRLSDPKHDKRLSSDSEVFRAFPFDFQGGRPSSGRSTSSSSIDGHRISDPELKKQQQQAVWTFFERKTGKRLSSSSMDSSVSSERTTPKDKYDASLSPTWRERSPSPQKPTERERTIQSAMKKSKSLPRDMMIPSSPTDSGVASKRSSLKDSSRERRSSATERRRSSSEYTHSKELSAPSQLESTQPLQVFDQGWDNSRYSCDQLSPTDKEPPAALKGETVVVETERAALGPGSPQTYPKTYEYSSSSSGGSSPSKPAVDFQQKIGYQVTINRAYKDEDEEEPSPPPPTLPPRNYRPSLPERQKTNNKYQRHAQEAHQRAHTYGNDGIADFENTPKAEYYADQLRQQARRISQSQPTMLNAARYQPKPLPEMKTSISVSRPVDKPPVAQEAKAPPTIYRSVQIPKDLNFVGINSDPLEYKSVVSPTSQLPQPPVPSPRNSQAEEEENPYEPIEVQLDSDGGYLSPVQVEASRTPGYTSPRSPDHPSPASPSQTSGSRARPQPSPRPRTRQHSQGSYRAPGSRGSDVSLTDSVHQMDKYSSPDLPPAPLPPPESGESPWLPPPPTPDNEITEEPRKQLVFDKDRPAHPRYSNESYMVNRGNVRQGFGGNYGRRDNSPPSTPLSHHHNTQPETMVKVATVMTVKTTMPPMESKVKSDGSSRLMPESAHCDDPSTRHVAPSQQDTDSPSVRAFVANFEKRDWRSVRMERPLVPRTKVQELKESLLRRSQENLSELGSPNRSPHRSMENLAKLPLAPVRQEHQVAVESVKQGTHVAVNSVQLEPKPITCVSPEHSSTSPQDHLPKRDFSPVAPSLVSEGNYETISPISSPPDSLPSESPPPPPPPTSDITQLPSGATPVLGDLRTSDLSPVETKVQEASPPTEAGSPPASSVEVVHVRQKSQEEIAYEQQAQVVASQLAEQDRTLVDVIVPPPEHKTTCDFMAGIFPSSPGITRRPSRAAQLRKEAQEKGGLNSVDKEATVMSSTTVLPSTSAYWTSPGVATLQNKMREEGVDAKHLLHDLGGANTTLERQKEELVSRLERKLEILREEKGALEEEAKENAQLGKQVERVVEQKCQNQQEVSKYRLYVDELDKVMYLLLKLSGRLARAENAVRSLPENASEKEKSILTTKRDELSGKHEDAKQLKEGIDRRSHLVATYLRKYLSEEEFGDYEYFIQMKSKLNMDTQEIDDKIKLGEEQLLALRKSINTLPSS